MNPDLVQKLIQAAKAVMKNAYCPYSNFPVGSAVLCEDGSIYTGCNVENATQTPGICAERSAYIQAVAHGKQKFKAVAITSNMKDFCPPCGTCRQFMAEFGTDLLVILTRKDSSYEIVSLDELLPRSFGPKSLQNI